MSESVEVGPHLVDLPSAEHYLPAFGDQIRVAGQLLIDFNFEVLGRIEKSRSDDRVVLVKVRPSQITLDRLTMLHDINTSRAVTAKVYSPGGNQRQLDAFHNEAAILDDLDHSNIVNFLGVFQVSCRCNCQHRVDGMKFKSVADVYQVPKEYPLYCVVILEQEGANLKTIIDHLNMKPLSLAEVAFIFGQIGEALRYLHTKHRITHNNVSLEHIVTSCVHDQLTRNSWQDYNLKLVSLSSATKCSKLEARQANRHLTSSMITKAGDAKENQFMGVNRFTLETKKFASMLLNLVPKDVQTRRYRRHRGKIKIIETSVEILSPLQAKFIQLLKTMASKGMTVASAFDRLVRKNHISNRKKIRSLNLRNDFGR